MYECLNFETDRSTSLFERQPFVSKHTSVTMHPFRNRTMVRSRTVQQSLSASWPCPPMSAAQRPSARSVEPLRYYCTVPRLVLILPTSFVTASSRIMSTRFQTSTFYLHTCPALPTSCQFIPNSFSFISVRHSCPPFIIHPLYLLLLNA